MLLKPIHTIGQGTVNLRPIAGNYQLSHLRSSRGSNSDLGGGMGSLLPLHNRGTIQNNTLLSKQLFSL